MNHLSVFVLAVAGILHSRHKLLTLCHLSSDWIVRMYLYGVSNCKQQFVSQSNEPALNNTTHSFTKARGQILVVVGQGNIKLGGHRLPKRKMAISICE